MLFSFIGYFPSPVSYGEDLQFRDAPKAVVSADVLPDVVLLPGNKIGT